MALRRPIRRLALAVPLAALVLGALVGCRTGPEASVATPYGLARAETQAEAAVLADLLEELGPQVRELLPDSIDRPTEVWLEDFDRYAALADRPGVVGLTSVEAGRIRIRDDRLGRDADYVLVHELVHALLGRSWEPLPAVMKEGLCDGIAGRLVPRVAKGVLAVRLFDASFAHRNMVLELNHYEPTLQERERVAIPLADVERLTPTEALELQGRGIHLHDEFENENALYGYGLLLTERIVDREGFEGLHELCLRATDEGLASVPPEWILEAAGIDAEPSAWRGAVLERIDDALLLAQCNHVSGQLAGYIVAKFRFQYPELSGEDFLLRALPTIGWAGSDVRVPLAAADELSDRILERWERSGPTVLRAGDGWWLHDEDGVHLTSILAPTASEPWFTISRLGMGQPSTRPALEDLASLLPMSAETRVEALVQLGRDADGVFVRSLLPRPFEQFRVEIDGFPTADLAHGLNVMLSRDPQGWWVATSRIHADVELSDLVLYHQGANVVVSQRAAGDAVGGDQHFPIFLSYRR